MLALGEDDLVEQIKKCFQTDTPLPSALHDAAMQLLPSVSCGRRYARVRNAVC